MQDPNDGEGHGHGALDLELPLASRAHLNHQPSCSVQPNQLPLQTLIVSENPHGIPQAEDMSDNSYFLNQMSPRSIPFSMRTNKPKEVAHTNTSMLSPSRISESRSVEKKDSGHIGSDEEHATLIPSTVQKRSPPPIDAVYECLAQRVEAELQAEQEALTVEIGKKLILQKQQPGQSPMKASPVNSSAEKPSGSTTSFIEKNKMLAKKWSIQPRAKYTANFSPPTKAKQPPSKSKDKPAPEKNFFLKNEKGLFNLGNQVTHSVMESRKNIGRKAEQQQQSVASGASKKEVSKQPSQTFDKSDSMIEQPEHTREQRIPQVRVGQLPKPAMKNRNPGTTTGKYLSVNSRLQSPIGGQRKSMVTTNAAPATHIAPAAFTSKHPKPTGAMSIKSQKSQDSKYSASYKGIPRVQLQVPVRQRKPSGVTGKASIPGSGQRPCLATDPYKVKGNQIDIGPGSNLAKYQNATRRLDRAPMQQRLRNTSPLPQKFDTSYNTQYALQNQKVNPTRNNQMGKPSGGLTSATGKQRSEKSFNSNAQKKSSKAPSSNIFASSINKLVDFLNSSKGDHKGSKNLESHTASLLEPQLVSSSEKKPEAPADKRLRYKKSVEHTNRLYMQAFKDKSKKPSESPEEKIPAKSSAPKKPHGRSAQPQQHALQTEGSLPTVEGVYGSRKLSLDDSVSLRQSQGLLPQSQEILIRLFREEFWPIAQKVMQKEHNDQFVNMLDVYDLQYCENWKQSQEYLFKQMDFRHHPQEARQVLKERLKIEKKSEEFILRMENVEAIMGGLGFLKEKSDNYDDKFEFIRFWEAVVSMQLKEETRDAKKLQRITPFQKVRDLSESVESSLNIINQHFENHSKSNCDNSAIPKSQRNNLDSINTKRSATEERLREKLGLPKDEHQEDFGAMDDAYLLPAGQIDDGEPALSGRSRKMSEEIYGTKLAGASYGPVLSQKQKARENIKTENDDFESRIMNRPKSENCYKSPNKYCPTSRAALKKESQPSSPHINKDPSRVNTSEQADAVVTELNTSVIVQQRTDQQQKKISKGVKAKVVIEALLNVEGVIKNNLSIFYKFRRLKDNRDEYLNKKKELLKKDQTKKKEIKRKKKEDEQRQVKLLKEQRAQGIQQKGYFGIRPESKRKADEKHQKMIEENQKQNANQGAQNAFFKNNLRVYLSPGSPKKKRAAVAKINTTDLDQPPPPKFNFASPRLADLSRNTQPYSYSMLGLNKKKDHNSFNSVKNIQNRLGPQFSQEPSIRFLNSGQSEVRKFEFTSITHSAESASRLPQKRPQSESKTNFRPQPDQEVPSSMSYIQSRLLNEVGGSRLDERSRPDGSIELTDRSLPLGNRLEENIMSSDNLRMKGSSSQLTNIQEGSKPSPFNFGSQPNTSALISNVDGMPSHRQNQRSQEQFEAMEQQTNPSQMLQDSFSQPDTNPQFDPMYPTQPIYGLNALQAENSGKLEIRFIHRDPSINHTLSNLNRSTETIRTPSAAELANLPFQDGRTSSFLDRTSPAQKPPSLNSSYIKKNLSQVEEQKYVTSPIGRDRSKAYSGSKYSRATTSPKKGVAQNSAPQPPRKVEAPKLKTFTPVRKSAAPMRQRSAGKPSVKKPPKTAASAARRKTKPRPSSFVKTTKAKPREESLIQSFNRTQAVQGSLIQPPEEEMSLPPYASESTNTRQTDLVQVRSTENSMDIDDISETEIDEKIRQIEFQYKQIKDIEKKAKAVKERDPQPQVAQPVFDYTPTADIEDADAQIQDPFARRFPAEHSEYQNLHPMEEGDALQNLRDQIRMQASTQKRNRTLLAYNAEVIKEAFREDSMASSSEDLISGILKTQNSHLNSSNKGINSSTGKRALQQQTSMEDNSRKFGSANTEEQRNEILQMREEAVAFLGKQKMESPSSLYGAQEYTSNPRSNNKHQSSSNQRPPEPSLKSDSDSLHGQRLIEHINKSAPISAHSRGKSMNNIDDIRLAQEIIREAGEMALNLRNIGRNSHRMTSNASQKLETGDGLPPATVERQEVKRHRKKKSEIMSVGKTSQKSKVSKVSGTSTKKAQRMFELPGLFNDDDDEDQSHDPSLEEQKEETNLASESSKLRFNSEVTRKTSQAAEGIGGISDQFSPKSFVQSRKEQNEQFAPPMALETSQVSSGSGGPRKKFVSKFTSKRLPPRPQELTDPRPPQEKVDFASPLKSSHLNSSVANIQGAYPSPGMKLGLDSTPPQHHFLLKSHENTPNFFHQHLRSSMQHFDPSRSSDREFATYGEEHNNTHEEQALNSQASLRRQQSKKRQPKQKAPLSPTDANRTISGAGQIAMLATNQSAGEGPNLTIVSNRIHNGIVMSPGIGTNQDFPSNQKSNEFDNWQQSSAFDLPQPNFSSGMEDQPRQIGPSEQSKIVFLTSDCRPQESNLMTSSRNSERQNDKYNHTFGKKYQQRTFDYNSQPGGLHCGPTFNPVEFEQAAKQQMAQQHSSHQQQEEIQHLYHLQQQNQIHQQQLTVQQQIEMQRSLQNSIQMSLQQRPYPAEASESNRQPTQQQLPQSLQQQSIQMSSLGGGSSHHRHSNSAYSSQYLQSNGNPAHLASMEQPQLEQQFSTPTRHHQFANGPTPQLQYTQAKLKRIIKATKSSSKKKSSPKKGSKSKRAAKQSPSHFSADGGVHMESSPSVALTHQPRVFSGYGPGTQMVLSNQSKYQPSAVSQFNPLGPESQQSVSPHLQSIGQENSASQHTRPEIKFHLNLSSLVASSNAESNYNQLK